jgi:predicted dinucleotide-binding enzyme
MPFPRKEDVMKIGIIGTGMVGRSLGARLVELGHDVMIGTREPARTSARTEPDSFGNPSFHEWHAKHPGVRLGTLKEAASHGEFVVNATKGTASIEALKAAGEENLSGKILIDVANTLDFSQGMPPSLAVCNTDSLGEQIQRSFPKAKVVKTLNTVNALLMTHPAQVAGGDHTIFMSGNDPGAKAMVGELLQSFGWRNVIDLGDITTARGTEMLLPLWVRLMGAFQSPMFNFKIVR